MRSTADEDCQNVSDGKLVPPLEQPDTVGESLPPGLKLNPHKRAGLLSIWDNCQENINSKCHPDYDDEHYQDESTRLTSRLLSSNNESDTSETLPLYSSSIQKKKQSHWTRFYESFNEKTLSNNGPFLEGFYKRGLQYSFNEYLFIFSSRLYYSSITHYLYATVLLVNFFVIYRGVVSKEIDALLVVSECFVTFMLAMEVSLRILTSGTAFFSEMMNLFDVIVAILCVFLVVSSKDLWKSSPVKLIHHNPEDVEDIFEQSLTAIRFSLQLLRTIPLVMHHSRAKLPAEDVDFSTIDFRSRVYGGL